MEPLDRLRAHVLADPARQQALAEIEDRDVFCAAVLECAAHDGIALDPVMLRAAIEPDPLGLDRYAAPSATAAGWPDAAWLPVDIVAGADELLVAWAHFAGKPLSEPFFEDSRRAALQRPFNRLFAWRTPLGRLAQGSPDGARAPDGFVFHLSRCGSTLVAQMLAALPGAQIVSEAPALDAVVQLAHTRPDMPAPLRVALLRAMVAAYGRGRDGPFVLKLDSWHMLALPLFRAAFPDVPWVFLFRDPVEILVSQMRMRGLQTVPNALPAALYGNIDGDVPPEAYCAQVLAKVCDGALASEAGSGLMIDYADLPGAVEARLLPHFGIVPDAAGRAALRAASARNAKAPRSPFHDDSADKQRAASAAIRAAATRHLAARYAALQRRSA